MVRAGASVHISRRLHSCTITLTPDPDVGSCDPTCRPGLKAFSVGTHDGRRDELQHRPTDESGNSSRDGRARLCACVCACSCDKICAGRLFRSPVAPSSTLQQPLKHCLGGSQCTLRRSERGLPAWQCGVSPPATEVHLRSGEMRLPWSSSGSTCGTRPTGASPTSPRPSPTATLSSSRGMRSTTASTTCGSPAGASTSRTRSRYV